jgi:hypothetical protein
MTTYVMSQALLLVILQLALFGVVAFPRAALLDSLRDAAAVT